MLRPAQIQDIVDILHVIHESFRLCILDHHREESIIQNWLETKTQSNLMLLMLYNDSWVYLIQQKVVGFILVSDKGQILFNYTLPEVPNRGIGQALLLQAIECLQQRKLQLMTLKSTHTTLSFYLKNGFSITPQQPNSSPTIHMFKPLILNQKSICAKFG